MNRGDDRDTALGPVYLRSLLRVNLATSLRYFAAFLAIMLGVPLVFFFIPEVNEVSIMGLPLPWFWLGIAGFPVLVVIAWRYLRAVEEDEEDFTNLVDTT